MSILLWIFQVLLALLFLFSGGFKLVLPIEKLNSMGPPNAIHFSGPFIKFIGVCEVLGGLGLILPGLLRIRPGLTSLAAVGLVIIMIGATVVNYMVGGIGMTVPSVLAGLLAAFVAYGRWGLAPHQSR